MAIRTGTATSMRAVSPMAHALTRSAPEPHSGRVPGAKKHSPRTRRHSSFVERPWSSTGKGLSFGQEDQSSLVDGEDHSRGRHESQPGGSRHGELFRHRVLHCPRSVPPFGPVDTHAYPLHEVQMQTTHGQLAAAAEAFPQHGLNLLGRRLAPTSGEDGLTPPTRHLLWSRPVP